MSGLRRWGRRVWAWMGNGCVLGWLCLLAGLNFLTGAYWMPAGWAFIAAMAAFVGAYGRREQQATIDLLVDINNRLLAERRACP